MVSGTSSELRFCREYYSIHLSADYIYCMGAPGNDPYKNHTVKILSFASNDQFLSTNVPEIYGMAVSNYMSPFSAFRRNPVTVEQATIPVSC